LLILSFFNSPGVWQLPSAFIIHSTSAFQKLISPRFLTKKCGEKVIALRLVLAEKTNAIVEVFPDEASALKWIDSSFS